MKNSVYFKGRSLIFIGLVYAIFSMYGCSKDNSTPANTITNSNPNEVIMQGSAFSPSSITVKSGTKVTWRNMDGITHTVTSDNALFDSGNIAAGGSYSFTFTATGTYAYHCNIHSGMTGVVIVN